MGSPARNGGVFRYQFVMKKRPDFYLVALFFDTLKRQSQSAAQIGKK